MARGETYNPAQEIVQVARAASRQDAAALVSFAGTTAGRAAAPSEPGTTPDGDGFARHPFALGLDQLGASDAYLQVNGDPPVYGPRR